MLARLVSALLIVAGVASWLLMGKLPHLPITVWVIELQTAVGAPLPLVLLGAGMGLLLVVTTIATFRGRPLADVPTRRPQASRPAPSPSAGPQGGGHVVPLGSHPGTDWRQRVMYRASELAFESGVSLKLSLDPAKPAFELRIGDVPPERVRRSVSTLARFVAEIPRPAEIVVVFDGFKKLGDARKRLVGSAFAQHFASTEFTVGPALEGLTVTFTSADPGWDEFRPAQR
jgi:hypothetical protein